MSARSRKRVEPDQNVTARQRPVSEELSKRPVAESGLSVDPEDLGTQFLTDATEQNNFESSDSADASELSIVEGAPSDDALTGPNFDPDHEVWEQTVDLALDSGGVDGTRAATPSDGSDQDPALARADQRDDRPATRDEESSLLDEEDDDER
jgi:hypothetical protein